MLSTEWWEGELWSTPLSHTWDRAANLGSLQAMQVEAALFSLWQPYLSPGLSSTPLPIQFELSKAREGPLPKGDVGAMSHRYIENYTELSQQKLWMQPLLCVLSAVSHGIGIIEWFGLEGPLKIIQFQPSAIGRDSTHEIRLPRAPSSPDLRTQSSPVLAVTILRYSQPTEKLWGKQKDFPSCSQPLFYLLKQSIQQRASGELSIKLSFCQ